MIIFRKKIEANVDLFLNIEECKHIKARRLALGDKITLTDGKNNYAHCNLITNKSISTGSLLDINTNRSRRIIATAMPEGKRWNWLLQKATELGVTEIFPIVWKRSSRSKINIVRSEKIIEEACIQSLRLDLPTLHDVLEFQHFVKNPLIDFKGFDHLIILEPGSENHLSDICKVEPKNMLFMIGPEGGFDKKDYILLADLPIIKANLGNTILRIETAVLAVLSITIAR